MTSDSKITLVFPGQGCQSVGMGQALYAAYPAAREIFDRADEVLGFSISRLCFEGPAEELNDTANTQPAIYTTTMATWAALAPKIEALKPRVACAAGHSLGEFSALAAAGALDFADGLRLVRRRGEAMRDAGAAAPGGMAAIIGLDDETVAEIVAEASATEPASQGSGVWIANYNSPGQVVIAGEGERLNRAMELAKARGARRALPLAVSVACHTPLMAAAADRLGAALAETAIHTPWTPVVSNVTATPLSDPDEIRRALLAQLSSPVRWVESVQAMAADGVTHMLEVGPAAVVTGLSKRIAPDMTLLSVTDAAGIEAFDAGGLGA
jgi:[acyl-carrier-protein] S-malonyltransferase